MSFTLQDYKVSSVYNVMHGIKPDWEGQMNVLCWLARKNGYDVTKLQIVAILRDWSKPKSLITKDYPKVQVAVIDIPVWDDPEPWMNEVIARHKAAELELPKCTDEETWYTGTKWAVVKSAGKPSASTGFKRAMTGGVFDDEDSAKNYMTEVVDSAKHEIEHRPGIYKRCEAYCEVSQVCDQWKWNKP